MQWKDTTLDAWKASFAALSNVVFESGGTRSSFRIYAKQDELFIGEFIVLKQGAIDALTFGKGHG